MPPGLLYRTGPSAHLATALPKSLTLFLRNRWPLFPPAYFTKCPVSTGPHDFSLLYPSLAPVLHLPFALLSLLWIPTLPLSNSYSLSDAATPHVMFTQPQSQKR